MEKTERQRDQGGGGGVRLEKRERSGWRGEVGEEREIRVEEEG